MALVSCIYGLLCQLGNSQLDLIATGTFLTKKQLTNYMKSKFSLLTNQLLNRYDNKLKLAVWPSLFDRLLGNAFEIGINY